MPILQGEARTYDFLPNFPKNRMKVREFWAARGGTQWGAPLPSDQPPHSSKINFKYHLSLAINMAQRKLNFVLVILETLHCFKILTILKGTLRKLSLLIFLVESII